MHVEMTLGDFFRICSENPGILLFYMIAVPLTALLAWIFGRGEGHISPWKYLYSFLVYLTCIPGIFAITLSIYLVLFEQRSILETNIFTQIVPVISMVVTLVLIRRNVSLDDVPGFGKLSGLIMIITAVIALLWILDRMRIFAITFIPFIWIVVFFLLMMLFVIIGIRRLKS
jgi:hypothetical protein